MTLRNHDPAQESPQGTVQVKNDPASGCPAAAIGDLDRDCSAPSATWLRWLWARLVLPVTLGWNLLLARVLHVRRWWDEIDPLVIIGGWPFPSDAQRLARLGVKAVVNTCGEYRGPVRQYEEHGIQQLWIPTIDYTHPALEDVRRGVQFMRQFTDRGQRVYVHCKAGRARSATVVMCWLMEVRGMSPADAQRLLLSRRPHTNKHLTERPVVQEYAELLADKASQADHPS